MLAAALVPASMIIANFTLLLVQLLLPRFIAAADYAQFAVLLASGQFVASLCFEWMRFGVMRFSVGADAGLMAARRAVLLRLYALVTLGFVAVTVLLGFALPMLPLLLPAFAVALYAPAQGTFEARQALARAEHHNLRFSTAWLARSALSMVGALGAAIATGSGVAAFLGFALSYPITLLLFELPHLGAHRRIERVKGWGQLGFLAQYGLFAAASAVTSNFLLAGVRLIATHALADVTAGPLILALDLAQKALTVLGLSANVVLLQRSVRAAEFETPERYRAQLGRQISLPFALITPAAIGFFMIQPSFALIAVPAGYRAVYLHNIGWATVCAWLLALRLFSVDTLFMAAGRSTMAVVGPLVSVVVTLGFILGLGATRGFSDLLISSGAAAGLAAGLVAAAIAAQRLTQVRWPVAELLSASLASVAMGAGIAVLPLSPGLVTLLVEVVVGGAIFAAVAVAIDLCGLRTLVLARLRPRPARA